MAGLAIVALRRRVCQGSQSWGRGICPSPTGRVDAPDFAGRLRLGGLSVRALSAL
jgi:hypothetical protein